MRVTPPSVSVRSGDDAHLRSRALAELDAALAAKLRHAAAPEQVENQEPAEDLDEDRRWHRMVEEGPEWLMSERVHFDRVDDPLALARTYATQIAGTLEIERGPLEHLLSEMLSAQGQKTLGWLLKRIDTIECLPGLDELLDCDAMTFCELCAAAAAAGRAARDRGLPITPIFAMANSASSFVTVALRDLLDVPVGVASVQHRLGMRPWISFIGRFPMSLHDHMYPSSGNLALLETAGIRKIALQLRDPRQLVISNIYHNLKSHGAEDLLSKYNVGGVQAVLEYAIGELIPELRDWLLLWRSSGIEVLELHFEDFIENKHEFFHRILDFFGAPAECYSRLSGTLAGMDTLARNQGHYNFRLGSRDEWRSIFSDRQVRMIEELAAGVFEKPYGI
jgi:hypothetical protein